MKPKIKIILILVLLVLVTSPNFASAALINCGGYGAGESHSQGACDIPALIQSIKNIINFLFSYAGLIAIVLIVWAGFQMLLAGGNEERITAAKTSLNHAITGFVIILVSFVIVNFVIGVLTGFKLDLGNAIRLIP